MPATTEPAVKRRRGPAESASTLKELGALTDASLAQAVTPDHRTLGRIAWHLTGTPREMLERTGLHVDGPADNAPVPGTATGLPRRGESTKR